MRRPGNFHCHFWQRIKPIQLWGSILRNLPKLRVWHSSLAVNKVMFWFWSVRTLYLAGNWVKFRRSVIYLAFSTHPNWSLIEGISQYIITRKGECDKYNKCGLNPLRFFFWPCKASHQDKEWVLCETLNIYGIGCRLTTFHSLSNISWLPTYWLSSLLLTSSPGLSSDSLTCIFSCLLDIFTWILLRLFQL